MEPIQVRFYSASPFSAFPAFFRIMILVSFACISPGVLRPSSMIFSSCFVRLLTTSGSSEDKFRDSEMSVLRSYSCVSGRVFSSLLPGLGWLQPPDPAQSSSFHFPSRRAIRVANQLLADRSSLHLPGPANKKGNPVPAIPEVGFVPSKLSARKMALGLQLFRACRRRASIVARE